MRCFLAGTSSTVDPSLDGPAKTLEYAVLRLEYAIDRTFYKHVYVNHFKDVDLNKIAELTAECYAMASALARANRSYCQGHREIGFKCHGWAIYLKHRMGSRVFHAI